MLSLSGEIDAQGALCLTVADNGLGIAEDALKALQQSLNEESANVTMQTSYGLKNLHQRIRLYYGAPYGLTLSRNEQGGMTIMIRVEAQKARLIV